MKELITYNFKVELEYLDKYKSNHKTDCYYVQFQVLAEDKFEAKEMLEEWLSEPEQTGWQYKSVISITHIASSSIIVKENFSLIDEDGFPID